MAHLISPPPNQIIPSSSSKVRHAQMRNRQYQTYVKIPLVNCRDSATKGRRPWDISLFPRSHIRALAQIWRAVFPLIVIIELSVYCILFLEWRYRGTVKSFGRWRSVAIQMLRFMSWWYYDWICASNNIYTSRRYSGRRPPGLECDLLFCEI